MQNSVHERTLKVFHTLHLPRWHPDPGYWENDRYIDQHVSQLNAVGRHVAQSLRFHVLDLELLSAQVTNPEVSCVWHHAWLSGHAGCPIRSNTSLLVCLGTCSVKTWSGRRHVFNVCACFR